MEAIEKSAFVLFIEDTIHNTENSVSCNMQMTLHQILSFRVKILPSCHVIVLIFFMGMATPAGLTRVLLSLCLAMLGYACSSSTVVL